MINGKRYAVTVKDGLAAAAATGGSETGTEGGESVKAPMPGTLFKLRVEPGDSVNEGDELVVLEAMKMEVPVKAAPETTESQHGSGAAVSELFKSTGLYGFVKGEPAEVGAPHSFLPGGLGQLAMIIVGCVLIYLAIAKGFEPLLLLPIGFGGILANIPLAGMAHEGGMLKMVYQFGIETPSLFPLLIFMGVGVVERLSKTAANELINIVTILLGLSVGSKLAAEQFLSLRTLGILLLGLVAFCIGTGGGVLMARLMNLFSKDKINPLIGAAGVSAVPMAARVVNKVGLEEDPHNFLLMHAMGPNVSGVIGSAVAAGVMLKLCEMFAR